MTTAPDTTPAASTALPAATVLGYPRVGPNRELKKALESFWAGRSDAAALADERARLRREHRDRLVALGLDAAAAVPEDQHAYDQVLDTLLAVGAVPARLADAVAAAGGSGDAADAALEAAGWTVLARGDATHPPLEMTKWFDTNYHYLVPEIGPDTAFRDAPARLIAEFTEAREQGVVTRPTLIGPVTFLLQSKAAEGAPEDFRPLDRLADLLPVYAQLLAALAAAGAPWVQLDESGLVSDTWDVPRDEVLGAAAQAYRELAALPRSARPALLVAAAYGDLTDALDVLAATDIEAVALDLVHGEVPPAESLAAWSGRTVLAGVVDGHNIWRADLDAALDTLERVRDGLGEGRVVVSTATSLQHTPYSLAREENLGAVKDWLAFAEEKVAEVVTLAAGLAQGREAVAGELAAARDARAAREAHPGVHRPQVRDALAAVTPAERDRADAATRRTAQGARLTLPTLPTTTIGSFPQTTELRTARAALRRGELDEAGYEQAMKDEIASVIRLQEDLDIDVLVHGEPERNDMVQYFAELLDGFVVTDHGWVQSYGSRCTRPSILWGDVSRPAPMTVPWTTYAQSLTQRPVKGMLTGPVTILAWSFVRDDQPLGVTADQVALALRDEIGDLEAAGTAVIQVDEPALRELLPLRRADQAAYLDWSVGAFRLATSGVRDDTQIHTHLCYSEFGEVVGAISDLNADVTSIEAARSRMEILPDLAEAGYARGVGPGVWDIHSPRVPSTAEIEELLRAALGSVEDGLLWVNPDCGLKTRRYEETTASLTNLVAAAKSVRGELDAN